MDGVIEVDPLVFDLNHHGDGWPIGFRAPEKGGLVFFEIIVGLLPREETGGLPSKSGEAWDTEAPSADRQDSPVAGQAKLVLGDATGGLDGDIDAVVEERKGAEVVSEFSDPSEEAQPGGDAVPNEGEGGPGMQG